MWVDETPYAPAHPHPHPLPPVPSPSRSMPASPPPPGSPPVAAHHHNLYRHHRHRPPFPHPLPRPFFFFSSSSSPSSSRHQPKDPAPLLPADPTAPGVVVGGVAATVSFATPEKDATADGGSRVGGMLDAPHPSSDGGGGGGKASLQTTPAGQSTAAGARKAARVTPPEADKGKKGGLGVGVGVGVGGGGGPNPPQEADASPPPTGPPEEPPASSAADGSPKRFGLRKRRPSAKYDGPASPGAAAGGADAPVSASSSSSSSSSPLPRTSPKGGAPQRVTFSPLPHGAGGPFASPAPAAASGAGSGPAPGPGPALPGIPSAPASAGRGKAAAAAAAAAAAEAQPSSVTPAPVPPPVAMAGAQAAFLPPDDGPAKDNHDAGRVPAAAEPPLRATTPTNFATDFGKSLQSPSFQTGGENAFAWLQSPTSPGLFSPGGPYHLSSSSVATTPRGYYGGVGPRTPKTPKDLGGSSFFFQDVAGLPGPGGSYASSGGDLFSPKARAEAGAGGGAGGGGSSGRRQPQHPLSNLICVSPLATSRNVSKPGTPINYKSVFDSPDSRRRTPGSGGRGAPYIGGTFGSAQKAGGRRGRRDGSPGPTLDAVHMAERDLMEDEDLSVLLQLASTATPRGGRGPPGADHMAPSNLQLPLIGSKKAKGRNGVGSPALERKGGRRVSGTGQAAPPQGVGGIHASTAPHPAHMHPFYPAPPIPPHAGSAAAAVGRENVGPYAAALHPKAGAASPSKKDGMDRKGGKHGDPSATPSPSKGKAGDASTPATGQMPHPYHDPKKWPIPPPGAHPPPWMYMGQPPPGQKPGSGPPRGPPPPYAMPPAAPGGNGTQKGGAPGATTAAGGPRPPMYHNYPPHMAYPMMHFPPQPHPRHAMNMYAQSQKQSSPGKSKTKGKSGSKRKNAEGGLLGPVSGKKGKSSPKKKKSSKSSNKPGSSSVGLTPGDRQKTTKAINSINAASGGKNDKAAALAAAILRGVTMRPSGKWQAQLYFAGKSRYIGVFDTREKAALAYEIAREKLKNSEVRTSGEQTAASLKVTEDAVNAARKAAFAGVNEKDPRAK